MAPMNTVALVSELLMSQQLSLAAGVSNGRDDGRGRGQDVDALGLTPSNAVGVAVGDEGSLGLLTQQVIVAGVGGSQAGGDHRGWQSLHARHNHLDSKRIGSEMGGRPVSQRSEDLKAC